MSLTSKNLLFKSVVPRSLTIEQKAHSCSQQDAAALTRFSLAAPIPFSLFFFFFGNHLSNCSSICCPEVLTLVKEILVEASTAVCTGFISGH